VAGSGPGGAVGGLAAPPHPAQEVPKPYTPAAAARYLGILDAALRNKCVIPRPHEPAHRVRASWTGCLSRCFNRAQHSVVCRAISEQHSRAPQQHDTAAVEVVQPCRCYTCMRAASAT
jgi:hypothetical protein